MFVIKDADRYPEIQPRMEGHATTWHDGGAAFILPDGQIVALGAERVDRYKHSGNSAAAADYLIARYPELMSGSIINNVVNTFEPGAKLETTGHHLYHAASTYFASGFSDSAVLIVDGQGPEDDRRASTTVWLGQDSKLDLLESPYLTEGIFAPQSIGHFYTAIGALAGMKGLHEEGKLMGLAAYGHASAFIGFFSEYVRSNPDGSYYIHPQFIPAIFAHTFGPEFYGWGEPTADAAEMWSEIKDFMASQGRTQLRQTGEQFTKTDMDIAYAGQYILEQLMLGLAKHTKELTGSNNLCLAGGVALNGPANRRIVDSGLFDQVYIFPAAGDDGQATGKLLWKLAQENRRPLQQIDSAYFGPEYTREEIATALKEHETELVIMELEQDELIARSVELLTQQKVLGWFQGASELGPRALGHRSILADPRQAEMRDYINASVKRREWYRPLAPVVCAEDASQVFDLDVPSPFMLLMANVNHGWRERIPAVTHVDGTARVQTITADQEPLYYSLVRRFGDQTGVPVLLNTSFNAAGEPIVETPTHAVTSFLSMNLDALVIGNFLVTKALPQS